MRVARTLVVLALALGTVGAAAPRTCQPVGDGSAEACARRNWITAGDARASGGTLVVFAGQRSAELSGPSWSPRRPSVTGGGAWTSSGADRVASAGPVDARGVSVATIAGGHRGVIDSISVVLFARTTTWPATQHLRLRVTVDGHDVIVRERVAVTPRAPVVHGAQALSFVVTDLHESLAARRIPNGPRTRHDVRVVVGPAGWDPHTYLWDSVETPSEVSFNLPPGEWPYGAVRLRAG